MQKEARRDFSFVDWDEIKLKEMEKIHSHIKTYLHLGKVNQNLKLRKGQDNEEGSA